MLAETIVVMLPSISSYFHHFAKLLEPAKHVSQPILFNTKNHSMPLLSVLFVFVSYRLVIIFVVKVKQETNVTKIPSTIKN